VACAKFEPVHSKYWWDGQLDENDEIKLIMLSLESNFDKVEAEVAKLHTYETFVLQAASISKISSKAASWLTENIEI
jgi:periplasmic divalent cation tolerance protein